MSVCFLCFLFCLPDCLSVPLSPSVCQYLSVGLLAKSTSVRSFTARLIIPHTCPQCFRPAFSYLWPVFQTCDVCRCRGRPRTATCGVCRYNPFSHLPLVQAVLIPVADVSDLRSHICAQCFIPAFSPMPDVSDLRSHTYARCFRPAFSPMPGVSDLRSHICVRCFRPAFSDVWPVFQTCILICVAGVSDLRSHMCSRCFRPAFSYLCPVFQTCVLIYARCFRPAFSYLCPMFQTCVLRCVAGVSDLRSHTYARCFRPAFSYLCPVFQTCVLTYARCFRPAFSYLCPMFQTCVLRCVADVSDPRSHTYARCFRPAFSYLCPVFQTCGACRYRVRSRTARWTSCRTTGSGRWRATRVRTATRWWGCRPGCVRGTRPGTAMSRAVNSTTGCWVSR